MDPGPDAWVGKKVAAVGGWMDLGLERNKAVVRRYFEMWNSADMESMEEFVSEDFVFQRPQGIIKGHRGLKAYIEVFHNAFPDLHFKVENLAVEGNKVFVHWTMTGTHRGKVLGFPATGRRVRLSGVSFSKVKGGRMIESTNFWDRHNLLEQIGVK